MRLPSTCRPAVKASTIGRKSPGTANYPRSPVIDRPEVFSEGALCTLQRRCRLSSDLVFTHPAVGQVLRRWTTVLPVPLSIPVAVAHAGTWTRCGPVSTPDVVLPGFATASCQHFLPQPSMIDVLLSLFRQLHPFLSAANGNPSASTNPPNPKWMRNGHVAGLLNSHFASPSLIRCSKRPRGPSKLAAA
jgi:hypothetical protein